MRTIPGNPELIDVRKIWDQGAHNAFTDLIRFRDTWYCCFREGASHISRDGGIRLLASSDGRQWESAAFLTSPWPQFSDARDPKLLIAPDGQLMVSAAAWHREYEHAAEKFVMLAWFSSDGRQWPAALRVGDPNIWLWRLRRQEDMVYTVGYNTQYTGTPFLRLYKSTDAKVFEVICPALYQDGEYPGESDLVFLPDGTCVCLARRNLLGGEHGWTGQAILGRAAPPYRDWNWTMLASSFASPVLLRLPDGRLLAAGRAHHGPGWGDQHLALCELNLDECRLEERLRFPSGGDSCYPGMVWHAEKLWISYYSSHEGRSSIYLAQVKV